MPDIEFVDPEPVAGTDEDLAVGPARRPASSARVAWFVGLAVLLVVIVVGTQARRHGARHDAGPPSPAVSTSVPSSAAPVPAPPSTAFTESIALPDCAAGAFCRFDVSVPNGVVRAIEAHFGTVTDVRVATLVPTDRTSTVRSRTIAGQAGEVNVQVTIRPATARDRAGSKTSYVGAFATVYDTALRRGVAVTVSVSGPQTQTPSVVSVSALAADRGLLATH